MNPPAVSAMPQTVFTISSAAWFAFSRWCRWDGSPIVRTVTPSMSRSECIVGTVQTVTPYSHRTELGAEMESVVPSPVPRARSRGSGLHSLSFTIWALCTVSRPTMDRGGAHTFHHSQNRGTLSHIHTFHLTPRRRVMVSKLQSIRYRQTQSTRTQ